MNQREPEVRSPERTGQMTQVMRAASRAAAPKVLRIAMVQRGVVVDERVVVAGATVTVGPTERATFVVASSRLAPSHPLFEHKGGAYRLNLLEGMTGRVATRAGLVNLTRRGSQLTLGADARGKVVVGDATFLFQFVDERPPRQNVPLPIAARASLTSEIDWMTTIVAALSFLLHFGLVASLYGDWLDPPVDDDVVVGRVVETVKTLPALPTVEHHDAPVDSAAPTSTGETARAPTAGAKSGTGNKGGTKGPGSGKTSDKEATAISDGLKVFNAEMIGVLSQHGSSTVAVLTQGGDLPLDLLNQAARDEAGVGVAANGRLDTRTGNGGVLHPGAGGHGGLASIGDTHRTAPTEAGSAVVTARPKGVAQIAPPEPRGGDVPNAGAVVARMTPGFRSCYNGGLNHEDPTMHGSMRVTARIGPNGDVLSATASPGSGNLSGSVMACVANRVAGAHFDPPVGGGATLVIPVSFLLP